MMDQHPIGFWQERIGYQRSWVWRGWQIRYSVWPRQSSHQERSPIVLLHGFGAALEHWRGLMPLLAQDRPVYAIDLLGFGGSRKGQANFGIPLWTALLEDFLRQIVCCPGILVGNSLGSLVCSTLAAHKIVPVEAIALLSVPDVALRQAMMPPLFRAVVNQLEKLAMQPWLLRQLFFIARRPAILTKWLRLAYPSWAEIDAELLAIIQMGTLDSGADEAFIALSRRIGQPAFAAPMKTVLTKVPCPILILWGEQDRFVPPAIASRLAQANPAIKLKLLPGLGHCPHDEDPALIYKVISQWLEAVNGL